jgi:hypothetical protein
MPPARLTFDPPLTRDEHPVPVYGRITSHMTAAQAKLVDVKAEIRTIARETLLHWRRLPARSRVDTRQQFFMEIYQFLREAWASAVADAGGNSPIAGSATSTPRASDGQHTQWLLGLAREQLNQVRNLTARIASRPR